MYSLLKNCKVTRIMNSVAAGTSVQTSSTVDMEGYDGVMFIAAFGALTATQITSLKARQGPAANMSNAADLVGTLTGPLADTDGNKCLVLDIYRPAKRYVNCLVNRATGNAAIDSIIALQYSGNPSPVAQPTSVAASKQLTSPSEGTA